MTVMHRIGTQNNFIFGFSPKESTGFSGFCYAIGDKRADRSLEGE